MKKNKKDNNTLFIDATNECIKVTNNNRLTQDNIEKIVTVYSSRDEVKHFSYHASYDEIMSNKYNLFVPTYVEGEDTKEKIDIVELSKKLEEVVKEEQKLRDRISEIIREIEVK